MKPITRSTGARVVAALIVALLLGAGTARAVKVDFLWIIDNSPSMADKQATLSAAADNIASQLANASCSMDWRMAVAYTDAQVAPSSNDVCSGSPGPGRRRVCPFTSDINVFKNGTAQCAYVKAGTCGDSTERGFSSAAIAINDFLAGSGCAAVPGMDCALRPDARLVNIFFTDTGEQTPASSPAPGEGDDSVSSWLKYFDDYDLMAPGMQRAQVHGILCPFRPTPSNPAPCGDTLADPTLFDRYSSVIAQMGGTEGSIADLSHLSEAITAIVDASIAGACCGNGHLDPGEECDDGNLNDGDCCSSSCKIESSTTMCRAAAGPCDVAEFCTGTSSTCPADDFKPATFQCRGATGACDVAEFCSGASATCPADVLRPSTFECRPSVGACDLAEFCTGTSGLCPSDAKSTGTCRAAAGSCDVTESCDGVSNDCPADAFKASSVKCRAAAGPCDQAEFCTGASAACPADTFKPSTTKCRSAAGACDVAEFCTGSDAACPTDQKSTGVCRPTAGDCDVADSCDGVSNDCPADDLVPAGTECRAAAGECDVAETCSGTNAACPADAFVPAGTECRAAAGECDVAETCSGTNAACPADHKRTDVCRASTGPCDPEERCDGSADTCPADLLTADGTTCSDGDKCTQGDVCHAGQCAGTPVTCTASDQCHEAGVCDPNTGTCTNPVKHDGSTCDDGNACTEHESCWNGRCIAGTAVNCNDGETCTADTCNPATGCVHRHFEGMAALDCFCSAGLPQNTCSNQRVPLCVPKHLMRACRLMARAHEAKPKKAHRLLVRAEALLSKGGRLARRANRQGRISTTCMTSLAGSLDDAAGRLQEIIATP